MPNRSTRRSSMTTSPAAAREHPSGATRWRRVVRDRHRRAPALPIALMLGVSLEVGAATTAAAAGPSLVGCPLLLENASTGPCVAALQQELNAVNPAYGLTANG